VAKSAAGCDPEPWNATETTCGARTVCGRRPTSALDLALAWVRSEPNIHMPRTAARCPDQFDRLFLRIYAERCGEGIRLKINRTKLKISYRAASGSLLATEFRSDLGELPDITTVVAPLKKLQSVVDEAGQSLDSYSRFAGRHADRVESFEANVLLPSDLWSASVKAAVDDLDRRVGTGMIVIRLEEMLSALGGTTNVTRGILKQLRGVLITLSWVLSRMC